MTRSHRQRHRIIWIALVALLPVVVILALAARRPIPVMSGEAGPFKLRPDTSSPH